MFSEILQDSQEICDISKNTFYYRIPLVPASKNTLPSRIDVTSWQLIFWELSTLNSVISATTFIKNGPNFTPPRLFQVPRLLKSRNQVVQFPTTPLFQPPHHAELENVFGFHIKVWKWNVKCMTKHMEKQIFRVWDSYIYNIYCQIYIRLNTGMLLIRFNSIE